jgi:hypothetical protein
MHASRLFPVRDVKGICPVKRIAGRADCKDNVTKRSARMSMYADQQAYTRTNHAGVKQADIQAVAALKQFQ